MKDVSVFANEIEEVVGSPKSQVDFDSVSKDEGSYKELMEKPFTLNDVKEIEQKKKSLMCMNIFQPWLKKYSHSTIIC
jgi:hypothetical protein